MRRLVDLRDPPAKKLLEAKFSSTFKNEVDDTALVGSMCQETSGLPRRL